MVYFVGIVLVMLPLWIAGFVLAYQIKHTR